MNSQAYFNCFAIYARNVVCLPNKFLFSQASHHIPPLTLFTKPYNIRLYILRSPWCDKAFFVSVTFWEVVSNYISYIHPKQFFEYQLTDAQLSFFYKNLREMPTNYFGHDFYISKGRTNLLLLTLRYFSY